MDTFTTSTSYVSEQEKARQEELRHYYQTKLLGKGPTSGNGSSGPEIIGRPSEAFPHDYDPVRDGMVGIVARDSRDVRDSKDRDSREPGRETAITTLQYDRGPSQVS